MSSPTDLRVEPGGIGDLPRLEHLWLELHAHHQSVAPHLGPFTSDEGSWRVRRASYEEWLALDGFLFLAFERDVLIGYAMVAIHDPAGPEWTDTWLVGRRIAELETLVVEATARGGGIGSALLDAVESELERRGIGDVVIGVVPGNAAQRLYERRGYQPTWLTLSRFEAREPGPEAGAGLVERYLALLSDPDTQPDALRAVLHPDVRQIEHPNAINPTGQERDLQGLLDGVVRGRTLLTSQRFDVIGHVSQADEIMTRAYWTGTLASGAALTARFAMHFTLRDGLIWRQENYDCFDPLPDVGAAGS